MTKSTKSTKKAAGNSNVENQITSREDLNKYLQGIRDKLSDQSSPPIYALTALNQVLKMDSIYELLSPENKEVARDIWLRLKKAGVQVQNPPLLFAAGESLPTDL